MDPVAIVKIGGNVLDSETQLESFLDQFASIPGRKILVHGGGKLATQLAEKLGVPQTMIEGRRVTDAETLKIAAMVYGGWINKSLVTELLARSCPAIGVTGADADLIRSRKRGPRTVEGKTVDYGFVGDIVSIKGELLQIWMDRGVTPVIAPLTHDGAGQLLNTNADSIANAIATKLAETGTPVTLVYSFEKAGVLLDVENEASLIPKITPSSFATLKQDGKVFAGMIPKLENACKAVQAGVKRVVLGKAQDLTQLLAGRAGTTITHD